MRASTSAILRRVARLARGRPALATPATLVAGATTAAPDLASRFDASRSTATDPWTVPSTRRRFRAAALTASMFDTLRSVVGSSLGGSYVIPPDFSLDDFAALAVKTKRENPMAAGLLDTLSVDPFQIEAITKVMTEAEKAAPGRLRTPEHRRVAARVADETGVAVTPADVAAVIQHAAMLRIIMNRVNRETARGGKPPTSEKEFAEMVSRSQENVTPEERKAEAASLDGAFPANRPCPCGSGKKYKACCSPFRGGGGGGRVVVDEGVYGR